MGARATATFACFPQKTEVQNATPPFRLAIGPLPADAIRQPGGDSPNAPHPLGRRLLVHRNVKRELRIALVTVPHGVWDASSPA